MSGVEFNRTKPFFLYFLLFVLSLLLSRAERIKFFVVQRILTAITRMVFECKSAGSESYNITETLDDKQVVIKAYLIDNIKLRDS